MLSYYLKNALFCFSYTEIPIEFVKPLKNVSVSPNSTVTLSCEVNKKDIAVEWLKNGKPIADRRIEIVVDGYKQQLVIYDVTIADSAEYSCIAKNVSTKGILVIGKLQTWNEPTFYLLQTEIFSIPF